MDVTLTAFNFNEESSFANVERFDNIIEETSSQLSTNNDTYPAHNEPKLRSKKMVMGALRYGIFSNHPIGCNQIGRQSSFSSGIILEFQA